MKQLKRELQSVAKDLKSLAQKVEKASKKLDSLEKGPVVRKVTRATAGDTVLNIIKMSKKGVDTATLKKKTGFTDKKIWNIINRLKRQRKIKSALRGIYVKA